MANCFNNEYDWLIGKQFFALRMKNCGEEYRGRSRETRGRC
jgi:hypothetical protein